MGVENDLPAKTHHLQSLLILLNLKVFSVENFNRILEIVDSHQ